MATAGRSDFELMAALNTAAKAERVGGMDGLLPCNRLTMVKTLSVPSWYQNHLTHDNP
jgi:hypothetical protein